MKKIRLMAIALLAGSLGLVSCDKNDSGEPGQQEQQKVDDKVVSVSISSAGGKTAIKVGETLQLTANVEVEGNAQKSVSWKSSDTSVATVSAGGLVTAKKADSVTITATALDDSTKSATITLTINELDAVVSVKIAGAPSDNLLEAGTTLPLQAKVEVTGDATKGVTWRSSNTAIATVSQDGIVTGVDEGEVTIYATSSYDVEKSAEVHLSVWCQPEIVKVSISGVPDEKEVVLHRTLDLSASVVKKGNATTNIIWSSSNTSVAVVDANGVVTPKAEGKFTITATSEFDPTKSATTEEITVLDHGFDPDIYDLGYTFVNEWSDVVNVIEEFLGEGEYSIPSFEDELIGGAYVYVYEESITEPASVEVIIDGARDEEYVEILKPIFLDRLYVNSYDQYEGVDPTGTYTLSFTAMYDEASDEYVAPTIFNFYKSSDVWGSSTLTTDEAWDLSKISADVDEELVPVISSVIPNVPFVKLGEEYDISYQYDTSDFEYMCYLLEMYNYIDETTTQEEAIELCEAIFGSSGIYEYILVADYSIANGVFDSYGDALTGANYTYIPGENGAQGYYQLIDGFDAIYVSYGFGENGNQIIVETGAAQYSVFPIELVNSFVSEVLGSENEIPAYASENEMLFVGKAIVDEENYSENLLSLTLEHATLDELLAYQAVLEEAGFAVEYQEATEEYYPIWSATKGKLVYRFVLMQDQNDKGEYLDEGSVSFYIYGDESKHEVKGIYLPTLITTNLFEGSVQLNVEIVKIDSEEIEYTWESSDPAVATVDENGLVTLVSVGEVDITVTSNVEIPDETGAFYSSTSHFVIAAKPNFAPVLSEANSIFAEYEIDAELTTALIPEIDCASYDEATDLLSYYGCVAIFGDNPTETEASYQAKVEQLGFTVKEDEFGKFYNIGDFDVYFSLIEDEEDGDYFQILIYLAEEEETSGLVTSVDQLYDGAEICLVCLDVGYGVGAYNGTKNFARVDLDETTDGCTVFVLKDNGDGTWGLFDKAGNQYGADSNKNIKTSGSGVDFKWTIEIDEFGDAYLTCNDFVFMYNNSNTGGVFKTYASSFNDGLPVQIYFAGSDIGGGGGEVSDGEISFMEEILTLILGKEPVEGVNYFTDDGVYAFLECDDLTADIDELYALLSQVYMYCSEPEIDEYGYYDFYIYSDDFSYVADIYSGEDDEGKFIEIDIYDLSAVY